MELWAVLLFATTLGVATGLKKMKVDYEWKAVDFVFPNQSMRNSYTRSGAFVYGSAVPLDVDTSRSLQHRQHHQNHPPAANRMELWAVLLFATTLGVATGLKKMKVDYEWKAVDFVFPNQSMRNNYTRSGAFVYGSAVPLDVDTSPDGRIFVALPHMYQGNGATLATITNITRNGSRMMQPYPNWSWHQYGNCNSMTSVFRVQIDECGRLWVIDSGIVNFATSESFQLCPPQLLVFDLANNRLIRRHRYPSNSLALSNLMCTVKVETSADSCQDAYAYAADILGLSLYVYSLQTDRSWRVTGILFYPYPRSGRYLVAGVEFYRMGGVMGLAMSPPQRNGSRRLYFQSQSSDSLSWVYTSVLKNESNFPNGGNLVQGEFHVFDGTRESQAPPMDMDSRGVLFFSQVALDNVDCWNSRTEYGEKDIVQLDQDHEALQFVTGVKVVRPRGSNSDELWMLSCRFQIIATSRLNINEINFRIMTGNIREIVRGTRC